VKLFLLRILTGAIMMSLLFFGYCAEANAASITKTLSEDTKLMPPGVSATFSIPVFKKGTTVTLNENGEVLEGTLASDPWLYCVPLQYEVDGRPYFKQYGYVFREGTKVTFNDKGEVVKGTLSHNHVTKIEVPLDGKSGLVLRPLTEVSFYPNGVLAKGTIDLYASIYLRPVGWQRNKILSDNIGFVQFKEGTIIELNDKGEAVKGTLNIDTKLPSPSGFKVYEVGTTVEFDDNGVVVKATMISAK